MKFLPYISPTIFLVACCLPAILWTGKSPGELDVMLGLRALAVGWSGIFAGILAWFANPFFLAGVIALFMRKPTLAIVFAVIAIGISCTTFSIVGVEYPADEGNVNKTTVLKLLPGFYVWMTSMVSLLVIALVQKFA
jgi:hypothetical protein